MTIFTNSELPLVLTVEQMAELLTISRSVAYKIAKTEGLGLRVGSKRLIVPKDRLIAYLNRHDDLCSETKISRSD